MAKELETKCEIVSGWEWAKRAALKTMGLRPKTKEPTNTWKAKMLLAEHSPIRNVNYYISINNIRTWVGTHLVRHWLGFVPFVHSQREDRRVLDCSRDELPQGSLNDMDIMANAQALINVSRKRLCGKASKETREAWKKVQDAVREVDPVMADKMVPNCQYRNICTELEPCGYCQSLKYQKERLRYLRTDYDDNWTQINGYEGYYEISRFGDIRSIERDIIDKNGHNKHISQKIISQEINKERNNYCEVMLWKNGEYKRYKVHRLVAETFIDNPENKPQVNHKDGNTLNNSVWNLEWVTDKENKEHAWNEKLCNSDHRKRKIRCLDNNEIYESITACSKLLSIDRRWLHKHLKGLTENACGYKFEYVE